jgi:hypothetical protein
MRDRIKLFEEFSVNETFLKTEKAKLDAFLNRVIERVKDSSLAQEIKQFAAARSIDPYETYRALVDHIKYAFKNKVDFSGIEE